jgi:hypothetical protein
MRGGNRRGGLGPARMGPREALHRYGAPRAGGSRDQE